MIGELTQMECTDERCKWCGGEHATTEDFCEEAKKELARADKQLEFIQSCLPPLTDPHTGLPVVD